MYIYIYLFIYIIVIISGVQIRNKKIYSNINKISLYITQKISKSHLKVFSETASKKERTALAWSSVFASATRLPILGVSSRDA
jgi:hypothetical protein